MYIGTARSAAGLSVNEEAIVLKVGGQTMKYRSIYVKIRDMVLLISCVAVLVTGATGIVGLATSKEFVQKKQDALAEQIGASVQETLADQLEADYIETIETRSTLVDSLLNHFGTIAWLLGCEEETIISNPGGYSPVQVSHADSMTKGSYTLQLYLKDETVSEEEILPEAELFANILDSLDSLPVYFDVDMEAISEITILSDLGYSLVYDNLSYLDDGESPETYRSYYFNATWYEAAKELNQVGFVQPSRDKQGRGLVIRFIKPIRDSQNNFRGYMIVGMKNSELEKVAMDIDLGEAGAFTVMFSDEVVFARSNLGDQELSPDDTYKDFFPFKEEDEANMLAGKSDLVQLTNGDYAVFCPLKNFMEGAYMALYLPRVMVEGVAESAKVDILQSSAETAEVMDEHVMRAIYFVLALFILLALVVSVVSLFISGRISKPILQLTNDVKIIADGKLDHRSQVKTNDEIGVLANDFNSMTEAVNRYIADITSITAEKQRISTELELATEIQLSMLPELTQDFTSRPEFCLYAMTDPAKEVGGDFYDFFMVDPTHLAIVMADVSGKGVPAALFMAIGKSLIKDHTKPDVELNRVFESVNNLLCESNKKGLFITAFEAVIDLESGEVNFVNAGHEQPFIGPRGGEFTPRKIRPGFVLAGMEDIHYKVGQLQLEDGDRLFQYTDGVTEATSASEELYGMDRLEEILTKNTDSTPEELVRAVKRDVDAFTGSAPQFDDITMLCVEFHKK